ncbi:Isotrichodermin C-15 hydroxylase [Pleurostoma richardsiae]|uniref:Isotrichodermin C-15 hydroxylase n=1 Tax=Pleurostoma richardsiae TaxID=41990 RepID=A0AA38RLQ9_9PEZI|nr:Isotrichodermin C-15 hydroxylase [Pleurostoma richardsiae]
MESMSSSLVQRLTWQNVIIATLVLLRVLYGFFYNVFLHPLSGYPGPLLNSGLDLPKILHQLKGTIHENVLELHEAYGSVVRIAPDELSYITAEAQRDIHGNRGGLRPLPPNPIYGAKEREFFGAFGLLWLVDHDAHARHRKLLAPAFSDKSLKDQEPIITVYVDLLMQRMRELAGQKVDMWAWFNYTTFDIIGDLTFGEPFGCLQESELHPWIHFIFSRLNMMMYGQIINTMGAAGHVIEMLVPRYIKREALSHVESTKAKVDRRVSRGPSRPDFVDAILDHREKTAGLSKAELYADSQILVMAGSETSATLLAVTVYYLLRTPHAMDKLQKEIRTRFDSEADIKFATVSKLPYILAVINEALRIHPPLPAGINRMVPAGGAHVNGKYVPAGTNLQVPHWAAYHSSSNFRDPWLFVPERWLDGDKEYAGDNKEVFQPFNLGPRGCIGRSLAYMETRLILARLVYSFDMELLPDALGWNKMRVFLLYEKRPLYVKLTPVPTKLKSGHKAMERVHLDPACFSNDSYLCLSAVC